MLLISSLNCKFGIFSFSFSCRTYSIVKQKVFWIACCFAISPKYTETNVNQKQHVRSLMQIGFKVFKWCSLFLRVAFVMALELDVVSLWRCFYVWNFDLVWTLKSTKLYSFDSFHEKSNHKLRPNHTFSSKSNGQSTKVKTFAFKLAHE